MYSHALLIADNSSYIAIYVYTVEMLSILWGCKAVNMDPLTS